MTPFREHWDDLVASRGTAFQSAGFCQAFEQAWPGRFETHHVELVAADRLIGLAPAYLYAQCPRLDYYRSVGPFTPRILMSHALVGWYGGPVAVDRAAMAAVCDLLARQAAADDAVVMLAAIDGRDATTIAAVVEAGFATAHFHTLMVRTLDPAVDYDPFAALRPRYRRSRSAKLRRARGRGVGCRLAQPSDWGIVSDLLQGTLDFHRTDPTMLGREYVRTVLSRGLPGLEALLATDSEGLVIGAQVNFRWGNRYMMWLGGHRRDLLPSHCQSDLLYASCIQRAVALGCTEIQAGRGSYRPKLEYGFQPVKLIAAIRGRTSVEQAHAARWLNLLRDRHVARYPEVQSTLLPVDDRPQLAR